MKTIRVRGSSAPSGEVRDIKAMPLSDMEIALEWQPVPGASFYRVYRGTAADFKPSLLSLVAAPATARWTDKAQNNTAGWLANRLHPETKYYYRIEAVSRQNARGPASASVAATTLSTAQKACPPGIVMDLHAVLVTPLAPVNQVNLIWRSNVEPNISAYEIHRSTTEDFTPSPATLWAKQGVALSAKATEYRGFDHQMFLDDKVALNTTYYYKVRAVTHAGVVGEPSAEASVTTKKENAPGAAAETGGGKELMGEDGKPQ